MQSIVYIWMFQVYVLYVYSLIFPSLVAKWKLFTFTLVEAVLQQTESQYIAAAGTPESALKNVCMLAIVSLPRQSGRSKK